ncbi:MAG: cupin domain-containing protein [Proteobacteria bacterium]|nr:cupin domain-containing protein [Pseudomonadota bacterium]MDA1356367.1 cupin domain-containing protein [Pseudomonadota bacterium]
MQIRRVVTGHSGDGKAIVASDSVIDGFRPQLFPSMEFHALWGGDQAPTYPDAGAPLPQHGWFPPLGGFRFLAVTLPPASDEAPEITDESAAVAELEAFAPGLLAVMEPDTPGMHTTDSIDFIYVISGEVIMTLDDGAEVHLAAGDTIVQSGTRHAWRNPGEVPCRLIAVQIGAERAD